MSNKDGWQSWTPTWTYKRRWYEHLMFWVRKPKITVVKGEYKQVGKTVHIRIGNAPKKDLS